MATNNKVTTYQDAIFLLSLTNFLVENALFLLRALEIDILLDLHVLRFRKSEITFLAVNLRLCVFVISITITKCRKKSIFGILDLYHTCMVLEAFL